MRIAFKTFGCRANTLDSDALYLEAKKRGFDIVEDSERADAYVINSCTVTGSADRDARLQANRFKRQNPLALVGVIGCYAQVAKEELLRLPEVDIVVGTANKFSILDHFESAFDKGDWARDAVEPAKGFLPEKFPGSRHARANIKVQDGCNFSCSFCIIPQARGRSRSLPLETVLQQIDDAYAQGFHEVVLTGIHLAHYGWDLNTDLMTLLRRIFSKREGPRVRLSTLDPFEIPDELIAMLGVEPRLCPYFHIALQSGSDKILRDMRRIYSSREFVEATTKIEKQCPDTFIGVDVIVGFPGETEHEFQETVECLTQSFWAKLHVFPYSVRKGTVAADLPGKVEGKDARLRMEKLLALSKARYRKLLESQIGKKCFVVAEKRLHERSDLWIGHSENYLPVVLGGPAPRERGIYSAKILRMEGVERLRASVNELDSVTA